MGSYSEAEYRKNQLALKRFMWSEQSREFREAIEKLPPTRFVGYDSANWCITTEIVLVEHNGDV